MSKINIVTTDELRGMRGSEGLILQGCGGDLTEWVDGINEILTNEGILLEGTKFDEVHAFPALHRDIVLLVNLSFSRYSVQSYNPLHA